MSVAEDQLRQNHKHRSEADAHFHRDRALISIYGAALALSVAVWFLGIRAPLWIDETGTYWQINGGVSQIWPRMALDPPGYYYILWFSTKILGTSEVALRIPSILAMLWAALLLYKAARELFDREIALVAAVIFCAYPLTISTSADVRPFSFALLATNAAILSLLRLRHNDSNRLAALFGISAASVLYFYYPFALVLPALLVCYFLGKSGNGRGLWRQFGVAIGAFALACLPLIPGISYVFRSRESHVYEAAPTLLALIWTIAMGWLPVVFLAVGLVVLCVAALQTPQRQGRIGFDGAAALICASLGLIPILILFSVSKWTSLHTFVPHHRTIALPGIALCWAFLVSLFPSRAARLAFCVALAGVTALFYFNTPQFRQLNNSWKYAIQVAEQNASIDNAPVVICSEFVESAYVPMPADPKTSRYFAQLSYYKLSVPVVPMPYALNREAMRDGSQFLQEATEKHERFLALANLDQPTYKILDWLAQSATGRFEVRRLGVYQQIEVLEFDPR